MIRCYGDHTVGGLKHLSLQRFVFPSRVVRKRQCIVKIPFTPWITKVCDPFKARIFSLELQPNQMKTVRRSRGHDLVDTILPDEVIKKFCSGLYPVHTRVGNEKITTHPGSYLLKQ